MLSHPLTWIVLWVDVYKVPRAHGVDLNHGLFVGIDKMAHTRGQRKEAASGQRLDLAPIGGLSHSQFERAGDDGDVLINRVRVRRDLIAAGQSEAKRELTFLCRITVEQRRFGAFRKDVRSGSPLDLVRRENQVLLCCMDWKHE